MDDNAEEIKVRFFRYFFSNILKPVSLDELCWYFDIQPSLFNFFQADETDQKSQKKVSNTANTIYIQKINKSNYISYNKFNITICL